MKLCECGCGEPAPISPYTNRRYGWVKGEPKRYVHGHHWRGRTRAPRTDEHREKLSAARKGKYAGADHPNWKGGRTLAGVGYVWVKVGRDHPMAMANGYCQEHRLVMAAAMGRSLRAEEVVHHRNGIKDDNRLANLELLPGQAMHMKMHQAARHDTD